jgi:Zn-dependent M16 (insulinase) family peptidase
MENTYGFELVREAHIPELNSLARLWRHVKTGAELLSMENDEENKVFGIAFRTPPPDSTGLPHIMEHSVLCGSRKYPVKEPFTELVKGSLKTFLNAFTSSDSTIYPVASQNQKDFHNLVDVYLDAVFFPLIAEHTLEQEGWHYELNDPDDPLTYKGVVFNEMKGAFSSPDSVLGRHSLNSLFPDTPYGLESGGDPEVIPDLTYAQFKAFHETYYHPSNARIFFYGDDDPEARLRLVNEFLKEFDFVDVPSQIPLQTTFDEPRWLRFPYDTEDVDEAGDKSMVSVNWMLDENTDPETTLALSILDHILIGTPASPLRKALIDSGLGEDLTRGGLQESLQQMVFSTGLRGIAAEDADNVEGLVIDTLARLAKEGIEREMIEASLNTIEFSLREKNYGGFPRGIVVMMQAMTTWLYDRDPLEPLCYEAPLAAIKARLEAGERLFEELIRSYLLKNNHRTTVLLEPDPGLGERRDAAEQERLTEARKAMSRQQLEAIVENTRHLKALQETPDTPEALATIPMLELSDLDKENKLIPCQELELDGTKVLYHDLFTDGIVYLDVGLDLRALPQELLPYVSLFGQALTKIGTEKEDFVKLSQRIGRSTGGIWTMPFTSAVRESDEATAWLFVRGKATVSQADELLNIVRDVLLTVKLDNQERFQQIVLENKARAEAALIPGGHGVINTRLRAHFGQAGWIAEQMGGISSLFFLRQLAQDVEDDWPAVLDRLEQVRQMLLNRSGVLCNVTLAGDDWAGLETKLRNFLSALPQAPVEVKRWVPDILPANEGFTIPAQVNYVGKGANLYDLGYELDGSLSVVSNYLRTTWLWEKIRIQGGAYGAFFVFDHHSGVLTYLSYRDPNLLETVDVYDGSGDFLRNLELDRDELTKNIIGVIGQMDTYMLPDAKGFTSLTRYLVGETDAERQQRRDQVLSTTAADFRALAEVLDQAKHNGSVVVLGSQGAIETANAERKGWLTVQKAL